MENSSSPLLQCAECEKIVKNTRNAFFVRGPKAGMNVYCSANCSSEMLGRDYDPPEAYMRRRRFLYQGLSLHSIALDARNPERYDGD